MIYRGKLACFHSPEPVIRKDGITYFAADCHGINEFNGDLVINLTTNVHTTPAQKIPELTNHFDIPYDEIMIPWPDFGLPPVKATFWNALHNYIKAHKYKKVCIHCGGGHGRTGTALCSILIAVNKTCAMDAVDLVRDSYCRQAVETTSQVNYLVELDAVLNKRKVRNSSYILASSEFAEWNDG